MATPLTGSTVASTYTGLLKTSDNASLTSTLKSVSDGGGTDSALQLATTSVNATGDFSVATSKFTVASASGNTLVAGTLNVTGTSTVGSLTTAGNISTSAGTISSYGAITQTQSGQNNSLAGNLAITGNLNVTGATTLTGNLSVPGTLSCGSDFAVNTNKFRVTASSGDTLVAGTLGVTGATTLSSFNASGAGTVGTTLGVTGNFSVASTRFTVDSATGNTVVAGTFDVAGTTTLAGNLLANGNTTIGNANTDVLIINSDDITLPNISSATIDFASDTVLIRDNSASNKLRSVTASQLSAQCVHNHSSSNANYTSTSSGSGTEIAALTTSITPRSSNSKILVTINIRYATTAPNYSRYSAFRLTRNGTEIGTSTATATLLGIAPVVYADANQDLINSVCITFLDSPASSGSTTYKINLYDAGVSGIHTDLYLNYAPFNAQNEAFTSSMTLQEFLS